MKTSARGLTLAVPLVTANLDILAETELLRPSLVSGSEDSAPLRIEPHGPGVVVDKRRRPSPEDHA